MIWAGSASAIDLDGISAPAAIDQPQINVLIRTAPGGNPIVGDVSDPLNPFNPDPVPSINFQAYLDTGASGILLSNNTALGWQLANDTYNGTPIIYEDVGVAGSDPFHVSQPLYFGFAPYQPAANAAVEYQAVYNPQIAAHYSQETGPVRAQIGPVSNGTDSLPESIELQFLLGDLNVVGMPAMTGKTMVIDPRFSNQTMLQIQQVGFENYLFSHLETLDSELFLRTYLYNPGTPFQQATADSNPGIPATNLHVKLSYGAFDRFTTLTPSGAMGPALAHNPFLGPDPVRQLAADPGSLSPDNSPPVKIGFQADPSHFYSAQGSFLLDTGAGASMISKNMAAQLHVRYQAGTEGTDNPKLEVFDPANPTAPGTLVPNQFKLSVGGIGGTTNAAGFYLSSLLVPTMEGSVTNDSDPHNLNYLEAPVLVSDITLKDPTTEQTLTLDGIFGMNFLVGSLSLDLETFNFGDFAPGAFDWITFDETNGILGLALNSAFQMPLLPGDFDVDGDVDGADFVAWQIHFPTASGATLATGDADGDGDVDGADFVAWQTHFPTVPAVGAALVPEPGTFALFAVAIAGLAIFAARPQILRSKVRASFLLCDWTMKR
ncbi:MAG: PEP-CTERM sorting domain-containing protein [Pirellulales bacterium]|nr:PEP-CTERM sorting domain-containing protein [Pirellulales bacterium]